MWIRLAVTFTSFVLFFFSFCKHQVIVSESVLCLLNGSVPLISERMKRIQTNTRRPSTPNLTPHIGWRVLSPPESYGSHWRQTCRVSSDFKYNSKYDHLNPKFVMAAILTDSNVCCSRFTLTGSLPADSDFTNIHSTFFPPVNKLGNGNLILFT